VTCTRPTDRSSAPARPARPPRPRGRGPVVGAALAIGLALAAVACSSSAGDQARTPTTTAPAWSYPGDDWERVDPTSAGFDQPALDRLGDEAGAAKSSCLVVTRDGRVVDERTWQGTGADAPREAFSVTKSVTSVLAGIAHDRGQLDLDQPAADFISPWQGTPSAGVTVRDLLSNDSGRHWDLATDYRDMAIGARDKTAFAIALGQDAPPGQVWAYNNSAIQTLSAVLQGATGEAPLEYARSELFDRIGMAHSAMTTDQAGSTLTFMGLRTTCLDLARFGYLMLRDGSWDGQQIVSSDYVRQAVGQPSTPLNAAYGLLWWLNRPGPIASPRIATTGAGDGSIAQGQLVPGAPDDVFWALGFNNQIVAVIPSEGVVAVRMGAAPPADAPFTQTELTRGVLDALGVPGGVGPP
jgi:CubicO group peptidase (beta-lactamase class C family)